MFTSLPGAVLAANPYLGIDDPDMRFVYGLFGISAAVFAVLALVRMALRFRENLQVQRSSWRTFEKLASVKGLSRLEIRILTSIARRARVKRPSQLLASILQFDRLVDRATDSGWIVDDDLSHLEAARQKLLRSSQSWDGHQERRNFERAKCSFEIQTTIITKDALDEEIKTSYAEGDEKFLAAMKSLADSGRSESTRILDLSAGGMGLLAQDKGQFQADDYVSFSEGDEPLPFALASIYGRILDVERMQDQGQSVVHVGFLPYEAEIRKKVIRIVYDASAQAPAEPKKKKRVPRKKRPIKTEAPAPASGDRDPAV